MNVTTSDTPQPQVWTQHYVTLEYFWESEILHDREKVYAIQDAVAAKVKELCDRLDVEEDARYCCQWEGVQLMGRKPETIAQAAKELSEFMATLNGIEYIRWEE